MARVISVGCGEPLKGMGWYHLTQLLADDLADVIAVVEPWYLGEGKNSPGSEAFEKFRSEVAVSHPKVKFCAAVQDVPELESSAASPVLALIAGRTRDNPALFQAVCDKGATHVILEKPGAETAADLEALRNLAVDRGVHVVVGYNKNVSDYCVAALKELERRSAESPASTPSVTLEHNNAFEHGSEDLRSFLRGPGGEGMVHNMMCHEFALAVTFFGLRCDNIEAITVDPERSEWDDVCKDWVSMTFAVTMLAPSNEQRKQAAISELRFSIHRCGGNFSCIHIVTSGSETENQQSFRLPSAEHASWVAKEQALEPEIRPYFLLQSPDYQRLKGRVLQHMIDQKPGVPQGLVDINGALEVLRLADLLKPALQEVWKSGSPWNWTPRGRKRDLDSGAENA